MSGITWRHVNGRSPEYYLRKRPERACAFLDYDNDGWMDIYLGQQRELSFLAQIAAAQCALRNNRDGTFTDVTEKAGVAAGGYEWAPPWALHGDAGPIST